MTAGQWENHYELMEGFQRSAFSSSAASNVKWPVCRANFRINLTRGITEILQTEESCVFNEKRLKAGL